MQWGIDSRDSETDSVMINGEEVWSEAINLYPNRCDGMGWETGPGDFPTQDLSGWQGQACFHDVEVVVPCGPPTINLHFHSNIDQHVSNEGWAFSDVAIVASSASTEEQGVGNTYSGTAGSASYSYLGCFVDTGTRDLSGSRHDVASIPLLAATECSSICSAEGFQYFGLQWANECWCGNTYGSHGEASIGDCDADANIDRVADLCGNGQQDCGYRNAVYRITEISEDDISDEPEEHQQASGE